MNFSPELLLIVSVGVVGVLHTIVPDHWVPIALIARQRGWSMGETARAAFTAGVGHVVSTLIIASVIWFAGVAVAAKFGHFIDTAASVALIGFGGWIAISSWRELSRGGGHGHSHRHDRGHGHSHYSSFLLGPEHTGIHGPELQRIDTGHGIIELSIFEHDVPPRFRLSGSEADRVQVETRRQSGARQVFSFAKRGAFWESVDEIPEPHSFDVTVTLDHGGQARSYARVSPKRTMTILTMTTGTVLAMMKTLTRGMIHSTRRQPPAWLSLCAIATPTGTAAGPFTPIGTITTAPHPMR
jgi:hypothetical protein